MFQLVLSWGCVLVEIVIVLLYRFISAGSSTSDDIYTIWCNIFEIGEGSERWRLLLKAFSFFFFYSMKEAKYYNK